MVTQFKGKIPLIDYPWFNEVDRMAEWSRERDSNTKAFVFDILMSLAYADATAGLEKYIEKCPSCPKEYNSHIGFINLCSPCYENSNIWTYQKAAKPQSGALGKLSSEIILRFIKKVHSQFSSILSIGGTETADAIIQHNNGNVILAEVKAAPLLTFPIIFDTTQYDGKKTDTHKKVVITSSQLRTCNSALYTHSKVFIPLGKVHGDLWPFKGAADFITSPQNTEVVTKMVEVWCECRNAYLAKDRNNPFYYLANASGSPPAIAKKKDKWPAKESISDSKTSAGMDRTDDIKKGIYQVLKIGAEHYERKNIKTALISNLPAYRHGGDYVYPFIDMMWGKKDKIKDKDGKKYILHEDLRWVFDYIITLSEPILRDLEENAA